MNLTKGITKQSEDFSRWYTDVIQKAELADYAPVKGCMVIRPNGYGIWERIQQILDGLIKETGCRNAYFPIFIPESFIKKEKDHLEGFSPECAVVTYAGGEELTEKLIVRPTSETIMYYMFAKWVNSYRDLPLLINQWANVVRWEMRTRLFLRTSEFLWQEGHTAHATYEEAEARTLQMIKVYSDFAEKYLAIPVIPGRKSDREKFAGADKTYTIEILTKEMKCLQGGTSHNLGQNFSKAFGINFLDQAGKTQQAWQTSWGVSTRLIGAVIMTHGDDKGLILPPEIAPIQVIIVPIWKSDEQKALVSSRVSELCRLLNSHGIRTEADLRDNVTPGYKFNDWEMKGVPIRLELGPRDLESGSAMLCRRDEGKKEAVKLEGIQVVLKELLGRIQKELLEKARKFVSENIHEVDGWDRTVEVLERGGIASAHWCQSAECEEKIKETTKATLRCIPLSAVEETGKCAVCGAESRRRVYFSKAY
ncbi:MAG: proline--tRNA ligase [Candidatus Wallbacteria bacterium]|nr:proline--tRNA ligase [Candidatus Wallbacteria bacterium]